MKNEKSGKDINVTTKKTNKEIQKEKYVSDNNFGNKWILVSEILPEKNVEVLATTESGYVTIAERLEHNHWFIHEGSTNAHTDDLIAWMPLPEPYKSESEVE